MGMVPEGMGECHILSHQPLMVAFNCLSNVTNYIRTLNSKLHTYQWNICVELRKNYNFISTQRCILFIHHGDLIMYIHIYIYIMET